MDNVYIRKTVKADVDRIMIIMAEARQKMGQLGIDQWQYGYPTRDIVREDVLSGKSYVIADKESDEVYGTFFIKEGGEPTYDKIYDGAWFTGDDAEYLAVHRVAMCNEKRGTGMADEMIKYVVGECERQNIGSIRIDTHKGNIPMRKFLSKNEFLQCGTIYLGTGEERVAYEKIIK